MTFMDLKNGILESGKIKILENELMKNHTTFRIGGPTKYFLEVEDTISLKKLLSFLSKEGINFFLLGAGSNLLVSDYPIEDTVIIKLGNTFKKININDTGNENVTVEVGAGYTLPSLSKEMYNYELRGAEFCIAIPGTLGGGLIMNAGAHGSELKDITECVYCLTKDGEEVYLSNEEAKFSYRNSGLRDFIVVGAKLKLKKGDKKLIKAKMEENLIYRANTQPKGFSAGSIFKNPPGTKAWKLIRDVGLSGYRIGDVMFSEKHANFIINLGNGKANDVMELINLAKERVKKEFNIELELEIKLLGKF